MFLKDIWPSTKEINSFIRKNVTKQLFAKKYANVFKGDANWRKIQVTGGLTYEWDNNSTYVQNPPYFIGCSRGRRRPPMSSTRAFSACSSIRSPPTTSRRPARSSRLRLPENT